MNNKKVLAVFPGQGSQKVGMAKDLYDSYPVAKELYQTADQVLNFSLSNLCFEGPEEELKLTSNVQPAILTHSTICYKLAKEKLGDNLMPLAAAGHSLGEYSALVAANAISFDTAVSLVNKRGSYMQSAVPVGKGKMLAVLGQELDAIEDAISEIDSVEIANVNAPGQIVVSGSAEGIDSFQEKNSDMKIVPLPVSAPFHCSLMKSAQDQLSEDLDQIEFNASEFPVYSNFSACPLSQGDDFRQALKDQVTGKVRWVECMQNAIADHEIDTVIEFGPGNVLTGLMKRIDKSIERINIQTTSDLENL